MLKFHEKFVEQVVIISFPLIDSVFIDVFIFPTIRRIFHEYAWRRYIIIGYL